MKEKLILSAAELAEMRESVKHLCRLCGGRFVPDEEILRPFFPERKYVYLAMWLETDEGRKMFNRFLCSTNELAKKLSDYVGWIVEPRPLSNALCRLKK